MNKYKLELAEMTDRDGTKSGISTLEEAIKGRDVFVGVSGIKDLLTGEMVASMNRDAIVLPLTNPDPEIHPRLAAQSGARVIATGSYKFENRANNALVFPFTMRAILDNRIRNIDQKLLVAVANALADLVPRDELAPFNILPDLADKRIQPAVTRAVQGAR
jgi:malate dehydrogenase (oxaloacetate-decarboxylating)